MTSTVVRARRAIDIKANAAMQTKHELPSELKYVESIAEPVADELSEFFRL